MKQERRMGCKSVRGTTIDDAFHFYDSQWTVDSKIRGIVSNIGHGASVKTMLARSLKVFVAYSRDDVWKLFAKIAVVANVTNEFREPWIFVERDTHVIIPFYKESDKTYFQVFSLKKEREKLANCPTVNQMRVHYERKKNPVCNLRKQTKPVFFQHSVAFSDIGFFSLITTLESLI